jgi:hypothetical protein
MCTEREARTLLRETSELICRNMCGVCGIEQIININEKKRIGFISVKIVDGAIKAANGWRSNL